MSRLVNASYVFLRFGFNTSEADEIVQYTDMTLTASRNLCKYIFKRRLCPKTKIQCNTEGLCFNIDETEEEFDLISSLRFIGKTAVGIFVNFVVVGLTLFSIVYIGKRFRKEVRNGTDMTLSGERFNRDTVQENKRYDYYVTSH